MIIIKIKYWILFLYQKAFKISRTKYIQTHLQKATIDCHKVEILNLISFMMNTNASNSSTYTIIKGLNSQNFTIGNNTTLIILGNVRE